MLHAHYAYHGDDGGAVDGGEGHGYDADVDAGRGLGGGADGRAAGLRFRLEEAGGGFAQLRIREGAVPGLNFFGDIGVWPT